MNALLSKLGLSGLMTAEQFADVLRALLILAVGLLLARLAGAAAGRAVGARLGKQESMLVKRGVFYGLAVLLIATTLNQLGFQLSVLLGAAGVLTVAVGFASQTSASNLISGLFLIAERPFLVGDFITVEGTTGEVLSIDLLSVKMRTFDNLYVRVPNEAIIKARITNLTHFPLRRVDVKVGVAYKEDLSRVQDVLRRVADANPLCLDEPEPLFIFKGYGDSALEMQYSVWGKRENYLALLNAIHLEIKAAFDAEGIEIPFPHRTLYTGSVTEAFPVRVVETRAEDS
ncbi:mechanosensitive ion channel family protein [bacterium]|nr:mechanosensitive ion channel family protein [bacterium]MBU1072744.1 mechanosensitive ion channel family protein [bacterium]MBU1677066.1 mechanosensitive ion channel family protein [bacterium]